jgi:site-specific DNA-methyltransferase (adenine-specific)
MKVQSGGDKIYKQAGRKKETTELKPSGRYPANLILDEEAAELLDQQSGVSKSVRSYRGKRPLSPSVVGDRNYLENSKMPRGHNDTGGASRFFYIAKASKSERTCNGQVSNTHPTIKPLKLCEYLCILTKTPTGGIVLDPFAGSGTTCMAAKKTGRDFIGIEKEEEYVKIAEARIKATEKPLV